MTSKPTAKKQPFVIEPLNWVAPDHAGDDAKKDTEETKRSEPAKDVKN